MNCIKILQDLYFRFKHFRLGNLYCLIHIYLLLFILVIVVGAVEKWINVKSKEYIGI